MKRIIQLTALLALAASSIHLNAQTFPSGLTSWWRGESNIVDSVGTNNGNIRFYIYDGTNRIEAPAPPPAIPWDGNWHMAAGTYDGSTVRLYLDGVEIGAGTAATNNIDYTNTAPLVFGDFGVGGGNPY